MQRYLRQGEAGEVRHEPPFFLAGRCLTSPRRADGVEVALHFLIGAAALLKEGILKPPIAVAATMVRQSLQQG